jgi:hypothetical protein
MNAKLEIARDTWFLDGKYLMRATAKFIRLADKRRRDVVEACVVVHEGDPDITHKPPLFISCSHLHSDNLTIQLAEAERLGHIFISTLL